MEFNLETLGRYKKKNQPANIEISKTTAMIVVFKESDITYKSET